MYSSYPEDRINTQVIYRFHVSSSGEFKLMFYLLIIVVSNILRHDHTWLARQ